MQQPTDRRRPLGQFGEEFAAQYLVRTLGWHMRARNWRCASGELDLVACDGSRLIIVEVRTRASDNFGSAAESVGVRKLRRLHKLGSLFVQHHLGRSADDSLVRFDVIALSVRAGEVRGFEHHRGVTWPHG